MYTDSHQHFWKLEHGDYSWMASDYEAIFRKFMPADLLPLINEKILIKQLLYRQLTQWLRLNLP